MPFDQPWGAREPATATTSPGDLSQTLGNMLPMPERPPPQDPPPGAFRGFVEGLPDAPWAASAPVVGGMLGGGPISSGLLSAGGELGGQLMSGESPNWTKVGLQGALGLGGGLLGRASSTAGSVAEAGIRRMPGAQAVGIAAPYATAAAQDAVPLTNLAETVGKMSRSWNNIIPSTVRPVPTQANKIVSELDELSQIVANPTRPLSDVATIRRLIGTFIEGNKNLPEARALYGSLMADLRAAAATSPNAAAYLRDLGNDNIVNALMPSGIFERALLYGGGALAGFGGNIGAAAPAAALLGGRAMWRTPASILDAAGAGGALAVNALNPYKR